jgi:hypothetical protein
MLADSTHEPGSPTWYLHRLTGWLLADQPRMILMDRYYRGHHPVPHVPRQLKAEYQRMLARSQSNFMRIVAEAPAERLGVQGFRTAGDTRTDQDAWGWWVDNGMDVDANLSILDSIVLGRSYLSVWRYSGEDDARVQVEDARTTIVEHDRQRRRRRVAGLRTWIDDWTGTVRADVYLPEGIYQWRAKRSLLTGSVQWPSPWQAAYPIDDGAVTMVDMVAREDPAATVDQWAQQWEELDVLPNPSGEIPLVPLVNRPSTIKQPDGESELDDVYLTQDRINEMLFNRALAAWTTAYRQKWVTGLEVPTDEDGNPIKPFEPGIDRLWVAEEPETRFGEFGQTDLKPFIESVEEDVQHIAVQTRTPRHYFLASGQSPSGDAIKSAEAGLVAKVAEKQRHLGAAFAEVVRLRQVMRGGEAERTDVVWADPEFRTLAELTDAVIKQKAAGIIPTRVARERLGYSPPEIDRMERLETQEQLLLDAQDAIDVESRPADAPAGVLGPVPSG